MLCCHSPDNSFSEHHRLRQTSTMGSLLGDSWSNEKDLLSSSSTALGDSGISMEETNSLSSCNVSLEVNCSSIDNNNEADTHQHNEEQLNRMELLLEECLRAHLSPWCSPFTNPAAMSYSNFVLTRPKDPEADLRFDSPFSESVLGVLNSYYYLPKEYEHSSTIVNQLPSPVVHYWPTDFLFFLFYTAVGEMLQIVASCNLFDRGWRFNKVTGLWIARVPQIPLEEKSYEFERGTYQFFDIATATKRTAKMTLFYKEFAGRIDLPEEYKGIYSSATCIGTQEALIASRIKKEAAARAYYKTLKSVLANELHQTQQRASFSDC